MAGSKWLQDYLDGREMSRLDRLSIEELERRRKQLLRRMAMDNASQGVTGPYLRIKQAQLINKVLFRKRGWDDED